MFAKPIYIDIIWVDIWSLMMKSKVLNISNYQNILFLDIKRLCECHTKARSPNLILWGFVIIFEMFRENKGS